MHGRNGPLHAASEAGKVEQVMALIQKHPTSMNTRGHMQRTPLMCAARWGHVSVIECLVKSGALMEETDAGGRTALHWAVEYGRGDAVEALVKLGARTDSMDTNGDTPLHYAVQFSRPDVAQILLNAGGPVWVRNHKGSRPRDLLLHRKIITPGSTAIDAMLTVAEQRQPPQQPPQQHTQGHAHTHAHTSTPPHTHTPLLPTSKPWGTSGTGGGMGGMPLPPRSVTQQQQQQQASPLHMQHMQPHQQQQQLQASPLMGAYQSFTPLPQGYWMTGSPQRAPQVSSLDSSPVASSAPNPFLRPPQHPSPTLTPHMSPHSTYVQHSPSPSVSSLPATPTSTWSPLPPPYGQQPPQVSGTRNSHYYGQGSPRQPPIAPPPPPQPTSSCPSPSPHLLSCDDPFGGSNGHLDHLMSLDGAFDFLADLGLPLPDDIHTSTLNNNHHMNDMDVGMSTNMNTQAAHASHLSSSSTPPHTRTHVPTATGHPSPQATMASVSAGMSMSLPGMGGGGGRGTTKTGNGNDATQGGAGVSVNGSGGGGGSMQGQAGMVGMSGVNDSGGHTGGGMFCTTSNSTGGGFSSSAGGGGSNNVNDGTNGGHFWQREGVPGGAGGFWGGF